MKLLIRKVLMRYSLVGISSQFPAPSKQADIKCSWSLMNAVKSEYKTVIHFTCSEWHGVMKLRNSCSCDYAKLAKSSKDTMKEVLMRVEQEQRVTEDAHRFAEQDAAAQRYAAQVLQALLYRLSGDYNPLHSDPKVAEIAGFSRSIQHGLYTMGFAVRAIIKCIWRGDPNMIKNISGRFLLHVYPGETLIMEMWLEGLRVVYQVKVKERNKAVLSGVIDLTHLTSSL